jgi:trimeric autotransporter adhesin
MKNLLLLGIAFFALNSTKAQFITTNPSTTPVTISSDLNLGTGKVLKFNNATILKYFGATSNNIGLGENTGNPTTAGQFNVFIGQNSGAASNSGGSNVYIGSNAGNAAAGDLNFGLGSGALSTNTGDSNMGLGANSGSANTGSYNTFVGYLSGRNNKGGANTYLGVISGNDLAITGSDNMFLGNNSKTTNLAVTRSVAIGYQASVDINDAIVLGAPSIKVGIGTSSPTDRLHINGTVRFEGLPTDAPGGTAVQYLVADATGKVYRYTGTAPARIGAPEGTTAGLPTTFSDNWTLKNDFLFNKNKKGIIIGEGITSIPKGYGMYVTDGILTEKVKVAIKNSSDWADYVFNKDYKKMSLTEVEKFIKVNKHLPNIPSAAEMVSEGNDLAKTDAKLLEKIEELTLYMIEMKKENAQMKRQLNSLKRKLNK